MAIAFVDGVDRSNQGPTNGSNQTIVSWTSNLIAGNAAVCCGFFQGVSGDITSVIDSAGNSYLDCGAGSVSRLGNGILFVRGVSNIAGGTTPTVTAQFNAAQAGGVDLYLLQYSGVHLTSMWDVVSNGTVGSGTTVTSAALTPTVTDGCGLGFCVTNDTNGSVGSIAGVAATARFTPVGWGEVVEDRIFTSSIGSSVTASANMSTSITLGAIIFAVMKAAAGGGGSAAPTMQAINRRRR